MNDMHTTGNAATATDPPVESCQGRDTGRGYAIGYLEDVALHPEVFDYMERIEATFEPFGGEWLVHGTTPDVVEGTAAGTVVIIGFPSREAAHDWYASAAYQQILPLRTRNSRGIVLLVDGVPTGYRAADTVAHLRATAP